jgi:hypothetical protein
VVVAAAAAAVAAAVLERERRNISFVGWVESNSPSFWNRFFRFLGFVVAGVVQVSES